MARLQLNTRISPRVAAVLDELCSLRGLSRSEVVLFGILAQAEAFGLIPSVTEVIAQESPPPKADPALRERQRLSQQRSRARKQGVQIPKRKSTPGPRRP